MYVFFCNAGHINEMIKLINEIVTNSNSTDHHRYVCGLFICVCLAYDFAPIGIIIRQL